MSKNRTPKKKAPVAKKAAKKAAPKKAVAKKVAAKKPPKAGKRADWQIADAAIQDAFIFLISKGVKIPSIEQIAKQAGCDRKTVERHLDEITFDERFKVMRAASDKVILALWKKAIQSNNPKYMEMYLQLFEGLGEKKKIDITSKGQRIAPNIDLSKLSDAELTTLIELQSKSGIGSETDS